MTATESMLEYAKGVLADAMSGDDWDAFVAEMGRIAADGKISYDTLFENAREAERIGHGR